MISNLSVKRVQGNDYEHLMRIGKTDEHSGSFNKKIDNINNHK